MIGGQNRVLLLVVALFSAVGCDGPDSLHEAIEVHDVTATERLLLEGAEPNARDERGDTPLHLAAMQNQGGDLVRLLIRNGADVNARNGQTWTPLHRVIDREVAEVLIAHGADVNARDKYGKTPLHLAVAGEHGRVGEHDIIWPRSIDNAVRQKVLDAYASRHRAVVGLLLEKGADLEAKKDSGRTPLHCAALHGHIDDVRLLVAAGADIRAEDIYGMTPLEAARPLGYTAIVAFLESRMRAGPSGEGKEPEDAQQDRDEAPVHKPKSADVAVCPPAASELKRISPKPGERLPDLIETLDDPDWRARRQAAFSLGKMGPEAEPAIPSLIRVLENDNVIVRSSAAFALGEIGAAARDAVPGLVNALKASHVPLRNAAVYALMQIGPDAKAAVPTLIAALQDESAYIRMRAVQALGRIGVGGQGVVSALRKALKDKDKLVRVWGASALQRMEPEGNTGLHELIRFLEDEDLRVCQDAVRALGEIGAGAKDAVPSLIKAFGTIGNEGRMDILAEALGRIGTAGISGLVDALKTGDPETRGCAAWALGWIGPAAKAAVPVLIEMTRDQDIFVRMAATDALSQIRGNPAE